MLNITATILLNKLGITAKVINIILLSGGRQHLTYKVELDNNLLFVIKELNFQCYLGNYSLKHFNNTETFANYVNNNLSKSVTAIKLKNSFTIKEKDKFYLIFPWCEGVSTNNITAIHCQTIAKLLAEIHMLSPLKLDLNPIPLSDFNIESWQVLSNVFLSRVKLQQLVNLANRCQKARASYSGKRVLSHRDINLDNILWFSDKNAVLIDWESAGHIVPVIELLDVATNLGGIASGNLDLSLVRATIECYRNNLESSTLEMNQELYCQSYASWFHWLDYCLSKSTLNGFNRDFEVKNTLKAIELLDQYKHQIINYFN